MRSFFRKLPTFPQSHSLLQPQRPIVSLRLVAGTYHVMEDKKHLSPIQGAALQAGGLEKLYDRDMGEEETLSLHKITRALFHRNGTTFKQTNKKNLPGFSFTPALVGKVLHHLSQGTFDDPETKKELINEWAAIHKELTNNKIGKVQIKKLLDMIGIAAKEYPFYMTETILLSFLYFKSQTKKDISDYLKEVTPKASESKETSFKILGLNEIGENLMLYAPDDIALSTFNQYYETILMAILAKNLPKKIFANYSYQGKKARPDCVESAFYNLFNILLYNPQSEKFDFSLLSSTLTPHEKLKALYTLINFNPEEVNTPKVGQALMDMLSGNSAFRYVSENYELASTTENFISIMNYCFGTIAKTYEELSTQFSTKDRQITFKCDKNKISIDIHENNQTERLELKFSNSHAELHARCFKGISAAWIERLYLFSEKYMGKNPLFFSLMQSQRDLGRVWLSLIMDRIYEKSLNSDILIYLLTYDAIYIDILGLQQLISYVTSHPFLKPYVAFLAKENIILHNAIRDQDETCIDFLIGMGANVNTYSNNSPHGPLLLSPLDFAINPKMVKKLVAKGANPNLPSPLDLKTPLHRVIFEEHAQGLLEAGADPNRCDKDGKTPLHYALIGLYSGHKTKILDLLLNYGANPNTVDNRGETPLAYLLDKMPQHLSEELVEVYKYRIKALLKAKANPCDHPLVLEVLAEMNHEKIRNVSRGPSF
jgi:hypothetical protein